MPRFYFDIRDRELLCDETGSDFATAEAARDAAISALPDVARDELPDGDERVFAVTVRDALRRSVFQATLTLNCSKLGFGDPTNEP